MEAINALGNIGDKSAIPILINVLKCKSDSLSSVPIYFVRLFAVIALGKIGDESVFETLIETLTDEYKFLRILAAKALGQIYAKFIDIPIYKNDMKLIDDTVFKIKEEILKNKNAYEIYMNIRESSGRRFLNRL